MKGDDRRVICVDQFNELCDIGWSILELADLGAGEDKTPAKTLRILGNKLTDILQEKEGA